MQWPWSSAYRLEPAVATTLIGISAWWANGSVKQYAGDLTAESRGVVGFDVAESRGVVGFDVEFVGAYWPPLIAATTALSLSG